VRRAAIISAFALGVAIFAALLLFGVRGMDTDTSGTKAITLYGSTAQQISQLNQHVTALESQMAALQARVAADEARLAALEHPTTTTTLAPTTTTTVKPTTTTLPPTTTTTRPPTTTTTVPPTTSTTSTTLGAFDLQAAIDACPSGGTVNIPAGTFTISAQVNLKSGITVKGAGIDQTILSMPAQTTPTSLLQGIGVNAVTISDLTLTSPAASGYVFALQFSSYANVDIERVKVTNCMYALKADTQGSNLTVRDFTARACGQIYVSNLTTGLFERLDLQMVTQKLIDVTFHPIYICGNCHYLTFNTVNAQGGSGFAVQCESGPTDHITFNDLTIVDPDCFYLSDGVSDVTVNGFYATATSTGHGVVQLVTPTNVLIENFVCSGGSALVGTYDSVADHAQNVTFQNGSYNGPQLEYGNKIDNLVLTGVVRQ
jgi:hypothetical protein